MRKYIFLFRDKGERRKKTGPTFVNSDVELLDIHHSWFTFLGRHFLYKSIYYQITQWYDDVYFIIAFPYDFSFGPCNSWTTLSACCSTPEPTQSTSSRTCSSSSSISSFTSDSARYISSEAIARIYNLIRTRLNSNNIRMMDLPEENGGQGIAKWGR